ncbi:MAG: IS1634 family transposase [Nitrososphaera sp.]|nr:IS1634 family transposase [Nitrososphaera sp.]
MFIKRTAKTVKGKTYYNYLLVESVATPKGPRHRIVCSLGSLEPGPKEQWAALAKKLEAALSGQQAIFNDPAVAKYAEQLPLSTDQETPGGAVLVEPDTVTVEEVREGGPVHVAHQMWQKLGLNEVLAESGLSERACTLTELMTLNRLIAPASDHATPDWVRRTAVADVLMEDFSTLSDESLYRNLDRLHPRRQAIERALAERERTLFNLEDSIFLYDLTSTYFEGDCLLNEQAKLGYSRDKRPDCKQVVVGLILGREGFPIGHEVFDGNRNDATTVSEMLDALEARTGCKGGKTVVVDGGMASQENLQLLRERGYHYVVACKRQERSNFFEEFVNQENWQDIVRLPSPNNPYQIKSSVRVKASRTEEGLYVLCIGEERKGKDKAIRDKQEAKFLSDVGKLEKRIKGGKLKNRDKIMEAIGRLKERYPRVARYYEFSVDTETGTFNCVEDAAKKEKAALLDGGYVLRTSREDITEEEVWRTYALLTRVEAAFRDMKSPLMERPIFHQLKNRVQTHIFICVLAYHLLVAIEKLCRDAGMYTSWETLRQQLSTHQVVTVRMPTVKDKVLKIRKASTPEAIHKDIYRLLGIPDQIIQPIKSWESIVTESVVSMSAGR